jgi:translocation and assembly module TamA
MYKLFRMAGKVRALCNSKVLFFILGTLWIFIGEATHARVLPPTAFIPYKTIVYGVDDPKIRKIISDNSSLLKGQNTPPSTVREIKNIAIRDMKDLQKLMGEEGYFDAEFDFFVDIRVNPVLVYLKVTLGPPYTLGSFKIKSEPENDPQVQMIANDIQRLGVTVGQPAIKKNLDKASEKIIEFLKDRGHPFAEIKKDHHVIDRESKKMYAAIMVNPGPLARFGNIIIERAEKGIDAEFIKSRLVWRKGDIFSQEKILRSIQALNNTRLFKSVKIKPDDQVNEDGLVDMYIYMDGLNEGELILGYSHERKLEGIAKVSWEQRNLFGNGEILEIGAQFGQNRKIGEAGLVLPDFMDILNMDTIIKMRAGKEDYPGYVKNGFDSYTIVQYPFYYYLLGQAGVSFEINNVKKDNEEVSHRILGMPMGLYFSHVEGGKKPKKGFKLKADFLPHLKVFGKMSAFAQAKLRPEFYLPITVDKSVVFGAWGAVGMSPGAGKNVLPKHKLYYTGGANSVPGYKFQMAGPLDSSDNPQGGRSMINAGTQIRNYLTDELTLVGFMAWGTAYARQYPDFSTALLWSIGGGIEYDTSYGDFKLRFASPVRRREGKDNAVEVYLDFTVMPERINPLTIFQMEEN